MERESGSQCTLSLNNYTHRQASDMWVGSCQRACSTLYSGREAKRFEVIVGVFEGDQIEASQGGDLQAEIAETGTWNGNNF